MDDLVLKISNNETLACFALRRTVGVFRCVFESTMSKKSLAVGTGAIALRPLVDILTKYVDVVEDDGKKSA